MLISTVQIVLFGQLVREVTYIITIKIYGIKYID